MSSSDEIRPLSGVRVVEVADWIAAPFAATLLGDFGAEVVKIERPGRVDHTRRMGGVPSSDGRSTAFAAFSRNKRSVSLDTRVPNGKAALDRILESSDVLITNLSEKSLAASGLAPDQLSSAFPRLVILVVSGYGLTGPRSDQGAVDRIAQAFGGLTHLTGYPDRPPVRAGVAVADYLSGWVGAFGVLVALHERVRSGRGQVVDIGLYEPLLTMLPDVLTAFSVGARVRERAGNFAPGVSPGGVFRCADGPWLQISASSDQLYHRLMAAIGRDDLARDERFTTVDQRDAGREQLEAAIQEWVGTHEAVVVEQALQTASVPVARVNDIASLAADPQVKARENFVALDDPVLGRVDMVAPVPRLTRTPASIRSCGPALGEYTEEALREIAGLRSDELEAMREAGAI